MSFIFLILENCLLYDKIHDISLCMRTDCNHADISLFCSHTEKQFPIRTLFFLRTKLSPYLGFALLSADLSFINCVIMDWEKVSKNYPKKLSNVFIILYLAIASMKLNTYLVIFSNNFDIKILK